jgi:ABC-type amino acid transport substrate-binding protein
MATGMKTPNAKEKIARINAAIKALTADGTIARILKTTY